MDELLSSRAYVFIAGQVASGSLEAPEAEQYRRVFSELHHFTKKSAEKEKDLLAVTRDLRTEVREAQIGLEKSTIRKEELQVLQDHSDAEKRKLTQELTAVSTSVAQKQTELSTLRKSEREMQGTLNMRAKHADALAAPHLRALVDDLADTIAEVTRAGDMEETLVTAKATLTVRLGELESFVSKAEADTVAARSALTALKNAAEPLEASLQSKRATARALGEESSRLDIALEAAKAEQSTLQAAQDSARLTRKNMEIELDRFRKDMAVREDAVLDMERALASEVAQSQDLQERRLALEGEEAHLSIQLNSARGAAAALEGAYERAKRELRAKMDAVGEAERELPKLRRALEEQARAKEGLEKECSRADADMMAVRALAAKLVQDISRAEGFERKHKETIAEMQEEAAALDEECTRLQREEQAQREQISVLTSQRDLKRRELARHVAARKAAVEQSKLKEATLVDLSKELDGLNNRLRQFSTMYEMVKREHGTLMTSIHSVSQKSAEIRERIEILRNEIVILEGEIRAKELALLKEKAALQSAAQQRDNLRKENDSAALTYKEKQSAVEAQIMNIDKLNSIVQTVEKDVLGLKRQYESGIEARNFAGITVIDRNDELCILYEKSNLNERTLAMGEKALADVNEEVAALRITIASIVREIKHMQSRAPDMPVWAEKTLELQKQLVMARQTTERLCLELEGPDNRKNITQLGGEDPDEDSLKHRIDVLEKRLNIARQELLDKEMIMEELSSITAKARAALEAATSSSSAEKKGGDGLALAKASNECQARLKEVNRSIMATISELAVYQANSIAIADKVREAQAVFDAAQEAAAAGGPPTAAAERRWQSMERARMLNSTATHLTSFASSVLGDGGGGGGGAKTTAETRPTSYLLDSGLSRPYGQMAPFKPSETGANMRFFRAPEAKQIDF